MELDHTPSCYRISFKDPAKKSETIYVGSSVELLRRWREHNNPNYNGHGPFGKWVHQNDLTEKIGIEILETVKNWKGSRDDLKNELKRREFLWKKKYPAKFGKMDGLFMQPYEVYRAHRNKICKASRDRNPERTRERKRRNDRKYRLQKKIKKNKQKVLKELLLIHNLRQKILNMDSISCAIHFASLLPKPKRKRKTKS